MKTYLDVAARAKQLRDEAAEIMLQNPGAEALETAEKKLSDAEALMTQASRLKKLDMATDLPEMFGGEARPTEQRENASTFSSFKEFVGAVSVAVQTKGAKVDPRLQEWDTTALSDYGRKDLTGQTGSAGGILIPTQQLDEIMSVAAPIGVMRDGATVIQMSGRAVDIPLLDQTGTGAADNYLGGISVTWTEEGAAIPASEPKYRNAELRVREVVGYTVVGNSLLKDVPALATFLGGQMGFPTAIARAENRAFVNGSGVGQPLGFLKAPAALVVNRTTTNEIKFEDLANMEAVFFGESPMWVASIAAKAKLLAMKGPDSNPAFLWGNAITGTPATLLGHTIKFTDASPASGRGELALVDRGYYVIGDLESGTTLESSAHEKFQQNKTTFRIVKRVDGRPWLSTPITLEDGTTKLSPFVILNT